MANTQRVQRVADQIQKELAQLIQFEMKDPRIGFATVSGVDVSRDLSWADVYITFLDKNSESECKEALTVLEKAAGFLRTRLSKVVQLRVTPKLRFHYDGTAIEGARISALIDQALDNDADKDDTSES
ncbi:MAG: 30S ribosome-binding factor RbfA [Pseudomonadales bacterium]|nr:30S ribosome-binding factor RbfA [Pseudomonadales bacterium]